MLRKNVPAGKTRRLSTGAKERSAGAHSNGKQFIGLHINQTLLYIRIDDLINFNVQVYRTFGTISKSKWFWPYFSFLVCSSLLLLYEASFQKWTYREFSASPKKGRKGVTLEYLYSPAFTESQSGREGVQRRTVPDRQPCQYHGDRTRTHVLLQRFRNLVCLDLPITKAVQRLVQRSQSRNQQWNFTL